MLDMTLNAQIHSVKQQAKQANLLMTSKIAVPPVHACVSM